MKKLAIGLLTTSFVFAGASYASASLTIQNTTDWWFEHGSLNGRLVANGAHRVRQHGTGVIRSDGVRHNSGIRPRNVTALSSVAGNGRWGNFHRFTDSLPIQFRSLPVNDELAEVPFSNFENPFDFDSVLEEIGEISNDYYYAFVDLENGSKSFVLETLNPDLDINNFIITTVGTDKNVTEDDKMILIDDEGSYVEEIQEIVARQNRRRNDHQIDYTDVLDEIQSHLAMHE